MRPSIDSCSKCSFANLSCSHIECDRWDLNPGCSDLSASMSTKEPRSQGATDNFSGAFKFAKTKHFERGTFFNNLLIPVTRKMMLVPSVGKNYHNGR